jgi:hypothetical protein
MARLGFVRGNGLPHTRSWGEVDVGVCSGRDIQEGTEATQKCETRWTKAS